MRALTIRQPWAGAIVAGYKLVENRSWSTSYRGPLAIHAGKTPDRAAGTHVSMRFVQSLSDVRRDGGAVYQRYGAVVATAELVDCHPEAGDCCRPWGDLGVYHWVLADVRPLVHPIPWRGRQGLWRLDLDEVDAVLGWPTDGVA